MSVSNKKNSRRNAYGVVAGIFLTFLVVLVILDVVSPSNVSLYLIPISVAMIIIWLYAHRVSGAKPS